MISGSPKKAALFCICQTMRSTWNLCHPNISHFLYYYLVFILVAVAIPRITKCVLLLYLLHRRCPGRSPSTAWGRLPASPSLLFAPHEQTWRGRWTTTSCSRCMAAGCPRRHRRLLGAPPPVSSHSPPPTSEQPSMPEDLTTRIFMPFSPSIGFVLHRTKELRPLIFTQKPPPHKKQRLGWGDFKLQEPQRYQNVRKWAHQIIPAIYFYLTLSQGQFKGTLFCTPTGTQYYRHDFVNSSAPNKNILFGCFLMLGSWAKAKPASGVEFAPIDVRFADDPEASGLPNPSCNVWGESPQAMHGIGLRFLNRENRGTIFNT